MRNLRWVVLIVGVLVAGGIIAAQKGDAKAGKEIYAKRCATCHGAAGEGKDAIAKMLKVELKPLGAKEVQAKPDAELRKVIAEGKGKMQPVKGLSDSELTNLVAYLRTLSSAK